MDFHHLKYFVEVADKKSFSKAARTLHISQSAISRTIKALEEELGVVLFMRNAKASNSPMPARFSSPTPSASSSCSNT